MAFPFTHTIHAHSETLNKTVEKPNTLIAETAEARLAADAWAAEQTGASDWVGVIKVAYEPAQQ